MSFAGSEILVSLAKELIKAAVTTIALKSTSTPARCPEASVPTHLFSCPVPAKLECPPIVCSFSLPDEEKALFLAGALLAGALCFAAGRWSVRQPPRGRFLDARRPVPATGLRGTR